MKKPFKQTKLYQFLSSKGLDTALNVAGVAPGTIGLGAQALDTIKDLVVGKDSPLSPEDQAQAVEMIKNEMAELDAQFSDMANARSTEIERLKTGDKNYVQNALALAGVTFFFAMVGYIIVYGLGEMNQQEAFIVGNMTGGVAGIAYNIYNYYFSSTKGSREKNGAIEKALSFFSKTK